jgi:hypothetical protein
MTEHINTSSGTAAEVKAVQTVNKHFDLGALVMEDCQSYSDKTEKEILDLTKKNFQTLFKELFELKRQQRAKAGDDDVKRCLNTFMAGICLLGLRINHV